MAKPLFKIMWRFALMSSLVVSLLTFTGAHAHELRPAIADVTMTICCRGVFEKLMQR